MVVETENSDVMNSERSERKDGLGLGGRYIIAMMSGLGPGNLKARCSKDGAGGRESVRGWSSWWKIAAMPPPLPSVRGLSR